MICQVAYINTYPKTYPLQEKTKTEVPKLGKLHSNYSWLKEGKLTKYADPNYV